jgi:hypothetical protein
VSGPIDWSSCINWGAVEEHQGEIAAIFERAEARSRAAGGDYPAYLDAGGQLDRTAWEEAGYPDA